MSLPSLPTSPVPVVAVVGGAVAGSEAAALIADRGGLAVVVEQGARPYGKIEDGLPRWHEKLRQREYEKIDKNLARPGVMFVPRTAVGGDVSLEALAKLGFSAVLLANGAWRDRSLPIPGVDAYVGRGLAYQNPFVQWFNHHREPGWSGPQFVLPESVLVVGGGLASVDVAKIVNIELYAAALAARGHVIDPIDLEADGIAETLAKLGVDAASLGVRGATLVYRRRKEDMPLASAAGADPAQIAKAEGARVKIMDRVERRYLVHFQGLTSPVGPIVEGDRLVGLRCVRNQGDARGVKAVAGSEHDLRAGLVISSIGSVPAALAGVPFAGDLYDYEDPSTGRVRGLPNVFGLGNVLTGKGNIRDSRENAAEIATLVAASFLNVGEAGAADPDPELVARERAIAAVDRVLASGRPVAPAQVKPLLDWVAQRWEIVGYPGEYPSYIAGVRARG